MDVASFGSVTIRDNVRAPTLAATAASAGGLAAASGFAMYSAAMVSASFEDLAGNPKAQVPANRMGFTVLNVAQLKILQESITISGAAFANGSSRRVTGG
jgi:uncharacterized protein (DUF486 family)